MAHRKTHMASIPILMYHKIGTPGLQTNIKGLYVTPTQFEQQLAWLCRKQYTFCDFNDLWAYHQHEKPLPPKPIFLTFDDGHLDNYTHAFPLLQKHQAKATIFVIVGDMGKQNVIWDEAGETEPTDLFTWDQARQMEQAGIRIESHGMIHRHFDRLSIEEVEKELTESYQILQQELNHPPLAFAHPYGSVHPEDSTLLTKIGYRFACTTEQGCNDLEALDPMRLKRITIKGYKWHHRWKFQRMMAKI